MPYKPMFLDIETNGLDPDTIWLAVTMQDDVVQEHYDRESLAKALSGDFPVVGHNLIGFDMPVLEKLWRHHGGQEQSRGHISALPSC